MIKDIEVDLNDFKLKGIERIAKSGSIVCLHGWLDNANSFLPLMEYFPDLSIASFDLPGHGESSRLTKDIPSYSINFALWKVIEMIEKKYLGPVTLLSHSLGAGISVLLAAVRPDLVNKLILLDNFTPLPELEKDFMSRMRVVFKKRVEKRRYYPSFEDAIHARTLNHVSQNIAHILASRSVLKSDQGYYWNYDYRLQFKSLSKFTISQVKEVIRAVECDVLYISSKWDFLDFKKNLESQLLKKFRSLKKVELDTHNHHFHMEEIELFEKDLMSFMI